MPGVPSSRGRSTRIPGGRPDQEGPRLRAGRRGRPPHSTHRAFPVCPPHYRRPDRVSAATSERHGSRAGPLGGAARNPYAGPSPPMARLLYRLGRGVAAHPLLVVIIWCTAAVGVTLLVKTVGADTDNNLNLPGTGSQLATDLLERDFPPQQNGSNPIIFHVSRGSVEDSAYESAIKSSTKAIKQIPF